MQIRVTPARVSGICLGYPIKLGTFGWLRGVDLNHRPLGYEPNELPDCSTPRIDDNNHPTSRQTALGQSAQSPFNSATNTLMLKSFAGGFPSYNRLLHYRCRVTSPVRGT